MAEPQDLTGRVFGKGVVEELVQVNPRIWRVRYQCGHTQELSTTLAKGIYESCGACRRSIATSKKNFRHGKTGSRTYHAWCNMRRRCYTPSNNRYNSYGDRGISVCDRWIESFENFIDDMGDCPDGYSLERKDLTKGYSADNCIWADDITQANNKTNNILIQGNGEVWSLRRWCEILGIDYKNAWYRLKTKHDPIENILGSDFNLVEKRTWQK